MLLFLQSTLPTQLDFWWSHTPPKNRPSVLRNQREVFQTVTDSGCWQNPSGHNQVANKAVQKGSVDLNFGVTQSAIKTSCSILMVNSVLKELPYIYMLDMTFHEATLIPRTEENHWRKEVWKEEAVDDLPWKDERGPSSVRQTLKQFQRQHWGNFLRDGVEYIYLYMMGFSKCTDTILNWTEQTHCSKEPERTVRNCHTSWLLGKPSDHNEVAEQTDNFKQIKNGEFRPERSIILYQSPPPQKRLSIRIKTKSLDHIRTSHAAGASHTLGRSWWCHTQRSPRAHHNTV